MKKQFAYQTALAMSFIFFSLLLAEFILSLQGKSLCTTSSCLTVDALSLSHRAMVLLGAVYFGLFCLLLLKRNYLLIDALSMSGVCAEVIFLLRQALEYHIWCPFCLVIATGVFATAFVAALISPHTKEHALLCFCLTASAALSFSLTRLPVKPIKGSRVLVYSPGCPHCRRVLQFCRQRYIDISLCRETNIRGVMYCLGVKGVPALLVKQANEVRIIQGEQSVVAYLERSNKAATSIVPEMLFGTQPSGVCTPGTECR